jgi:NitT/TauT family transport system substrate-binding protein
MQIERRRFLATGAAAFGAAAIARPHVARAATAKFGTVSVRFNWTMKGEFTPFVVAREKGYYRDVGIEVQLNPGTSGTIAVQSVTAGHDHFGYLPSVQLIEGITKQAMPVKAVAECGSATGMCWASRPDVPLTGPKSLEGHRVSISPASTFFQVWNSFAKEFNIDQSKVQVIGADPSARVGLFLDGRVDIMADIFFANDFVILQSKVPQHKLNLFRLSDAKTQFDPLGYLLITRDELIQKEPAMVKAFTGATLRGLAYTHDHPDEAAELMLKAPENQLAPDVVRGQVHNLLALINAKPVVGKNQAADWNRSLAILQGAGVIERALEHSSYYTNAFLP